MPEFNGIITSEVVDQLMEIAQKRSGKKMPLSLFAKAVVIAEIIGVTPSCIYTWRKRADAGDPVHSRGTIPRIHAALASAEQPATETTIPARENTMSMTAGKFSQLMSAVATLRGCDLDKVNVCNIAFHVGVKVYTVSCWKLGVDERRPYTLREKEWNKVEKTIRKAEALRAPTDKIPCTVVHYGSGKTVPALEAEVMQDPKFWATVSSATRRAVSAAIVRAEKIVTTQSRINALQSEIDALKALL